MFISYADITFHGFFVGEDPMSSELRHDTLYKKDIQSFRVDKGSQKEVRYVVPYGSSVVVRVSTTAPVILAMAGPHIEQQEITGTKEYRFTADAGTELMIRFIGKTGFFAKPADVTLEVEMYTARDAVKIGEEISNLLGVLKELGRDYYLLNKEYVQDVLKKVANVWKLLDSDTKSKAKELLTMAKKFESGEE
jgi:hypothetical protein